MEKQHVYICKCIQQLLIQWKYIHKHSKILFVICFNIGNSNNIQHKRKFIKQPTIGNGMVTLRAASAPISEQLTTKYLTVS